MAWIDITAPTYWTSTNSATPGQIGDDYIWNGAKWVINTATLINASGVCQLIPTSATTSLAMTASGLRITLEAAQTITSFTPFACGYNFSPPPDGINEYTDNLNANHGDPSGTQYGPVTMASFQQFTGSGNYSAIGASGYFFGPTFDEFNILKIELETPGLSAFWTDFIGCHEQ